VRTEKVRGDARNYQDAHVKDIEALEDMERRCAGEMRAIIKACAG
jgi:hypothetical protein